MYGRVGLDRFKKAQSLEPFSVTVNSAPQTTAQRSQKPSSVIQSQPQIQNPHNYQYHANNNTVGHEAAPSVGQNLQITQIGGGQTTWQPPDWAIEPRHGVYFLEVLKGSEILDRINLDKRRHIFGRQFHTCDFVLDHQSVSRQHAAVVPHKNGSIYVIDLGSAHGTFVANERLTKDSPVELEVGQSLRFAASTRTYILRKNEAALFPRRPLLTEINLPPPPDLSDEEAVVAYNTLLNRYGLSKSDLSKSNELGSLISRGDDNRLSERASKRIKKTRVAFRDQVGGELVQVVGISDGADVETEPGPIGVKEGTLVGKYESLVKTTVIPKGNEKISVKEENTSQKGVTEKLQVVLNKVKSTPKGGIYDDLYGDLILDNKVGSSWAYSSGDGATSTTKDAQGKAVVGSSVEPGNITGSYKDENDDDLFGD
ncbi:nuclear inhibitor of protein phosphatase 1-like [Tripterygium wilfordii]|uniref:Nuclear inhibitor of protein phosphatase 1-like n=1 Tax=Tripterygium wilfordii TaxID=458696 RepID=A0A7J7C2Z0_TRIWF|nr:protein phosphatase 1 regulatory inhibitor subunit PPP1R8 homolog [Tripterygium wilfordii]XP_038691246.1 protein phosphatase 1 regulatory inhibitor subunit PPP1R8 homolog [Tripterygium wilfordii]XP_038691247.1 protein phosphatase 1 regulatory inhibitor subunit PPP1R8 homolog [Tripterygium wilfordii]XP_038691248.1 protein phosphatase 1 regulatory inhibitor subunit PPP1R8 homolog [Tripterygium wilfordii]KAF5728520.1 nuclear inhibitor of protein phosphatase 1-like [Tripterygium wilfordii]